MLRSVYHTELHCKEETVRTSISPLPGFGGQNCGQNQMRPAYKQKNPTISNVKPLDLWSSRAGQIRTCRGTAPPSCLLALRTVKLPFQSSRVIFLGRSPAEEHLPGIIQAKECMKKKKHISEEQHYLCEIGLEKMPYGSFWLYKSYTEESLTHITITAAPCKVPALP